MILYYDGSCPLCAQLVHFCGRLGFLRHVRAQAIDPETDPPELLPHFRESCQLVDPDRGLRFDRFAVPAELLRLRWSGLNLHPLINLPGLRLLLVFLYTIIAANRFALLPDPQRRHCAFGPGPSRSGRIRLGLILLVGAVLGSLLFGAAIGLHRPETGPYTAGLQLTLAAGTGWALALVAMALPLQRHFGSYLLQNLIVMNIGIFWLVPTVAVLLLILPFQPPTGLVSAIVCTGVLLDASLMARAFFARARALGLPAWTAPTWFVLLQVGGLPLLLHFHLLSP